jgi:hypothetical protein
VYEFKNIYITWRNDEKREKRNWGSYKPLLNPSRCLNICKIQGTWISIQHSGVSVARRVLRLERRQTTHSLYCWSLPWICPVWCSNTSAEDCWIVSSLMRVLHISQWSERHSDQGWPLPCWPRLMMRPDELLNGFRMLNVRFQACAVAAVYIKTVNEYWYYKSHETASDLTRSFAIVRCSVPNSESQEWYEETIFPMWTTMIHQTDIVRESYINLEMLSHHFQWTLPTHSHLGLKSISQDSTFNIVCESNSFLLDFSTRHRSLLVILEKIST